MTTFTNQTKNTSTFTNQTLGSANANPTFEDFGIPSPFKEAEGTWGSPKTMWKRQTKNTSSFTNQTKN